MLLRCVVIAIYNPLSISLAHIEADRSDVEQELTLYMHSCVAASFSPPLCTRHGTQTDTKVGHYRS